MKQRKSDAMWGMRRGAAPVPVGRAKGNFSRKVPSGLPQKLYSQGYLGWVYLWIEVGFAGIVYKEIFSFIGLIKRDSTATVGCESSEANPVNQGEIFLLRSSTPTPPRVRFLRDPAADNPHDSFGG